MRRKQCKKRLGTFVISVMLIISACMTANASYVTNISSSYQQVGSSGSQWRTKATGKSSDSKGWLQAAIKLDSDSGWRWGSADTGNKNTLTAYSKSRVGSVSKMQKKTDHN